MAVGAGTTPSSLILPEGASALHGDTVPIGVHSLFSLVFILYAAYLVPTILLVSSHSLVSGPVTSPVRVCSLEFCPKCLDCCPGVSDHCIQDSAELR